MHARKTIKRVNKQSRILHNNWLSVLLSKLFCSIFRNFLRVIGLYFIIFKVNLLNISYAVKNFLELSYLSRIVCCKKYFHNNLILSFSTRSKNGLSLFPISSHSILVKMAKLILLFIFLEILSMLSIFSSLFLLPISNRSISLSGVSSPLAAEPYKYASSSRFFSMEESNDHV